MLPNVSLISLTHTKYRVFTIRISSNVILNQIILFSLSVGVYIYMQVLTIPSNND